ncbi:MAG: hypothetical protein AAF984_01565 [Verrucomicrobiota bacterium]
MKLMPLMFFLMMSQLILAQDADDDAVVNTEKTQDESSYSETTESEQGSESSEEDSVLTIDKGQDENELVEDAVVQSDASDEEIPMVQPAETGKRYDRSVKDDEKVFIGKIHEFLNDPERTDTGGNKALEYEFKYFNYGAITQAQKEARVGKYYVVNWYNKGLESDFTVRLEYRQAGSRDKVYTIEVPFNKVRGKVKATFAVTGKQYRDYGQVLAWRILLLKDERVMSERRSFIW